MPHHQLILDDPVEPTPCPLITPEVLRLRAQRALALVVLLRQDVPPHLSTHMHIAKTALEHVVRLLQEAP